MSARDGASGANLSLAHSFSLVGEVALVTGSYRGLGYAIARGLARAGAAVVINGRDGSAVAAAVSALRDERLDARGVAFDVTSAADIDRGLREIEAGPGVPTILVNNAGIIRRAPMLEMEEAEWRSVVDIDLTGPFLMARRVVPGMITAGRGKIINICSVLTEVARASVAAYASAKGGLKLLTQSMATEWGARNIQANGIGPGYFATELTESLQQNEEFDSWLKGRVPAGRWGNPEELVGPAVFLASRASDFVNGQILYVDGGLLARL
jgi:gluconate 5-dehydrogenase